MFDVPPQCQSAKLISVVSFYFVLFICHTRLSIYLVALLSFNEMTVNAAYSNFLSGIKNSYVFDLPPQCQSAKLISVVSFYSVLFICRTHLSIYLSVYLLRKHAYSNI